MTAAEFALSFTLPLMQAHGCAAGTNALRSDSLSWAVYARVQSPTWLGMAAAMKAMPEVWAAYWPRVRAEAEPVRVASGRAIPGERVYIPSSPACAVPCWWHVTAANSAGEGCPSNIVEGR